MTYPGANYSMSQRQHETEEGQAIVELALTLPILILLLLGAVEFGRYAYVAIEISNAAKAAAQYGSQNSVTATDVSGMQAVAAQEAPEAGTLCTNFTTTINQPATCSCVSGGVPSSASCSSTTCVGYIVQYLTVTTSAQCKPPIFAPGFGGTLTISGHAIQEVLK